MAAAGDLIIPGGSLPSIYARSAVTSTAEEHRCLLAGTKLHILVTEAYGCQQRAESCCAALPERESNLRHLDRYSDALPVAPTRHI